MKILWVKAGGLVPLDTGGKIRSYNLLKELARQYEVSLFLFYAAHPDDSHGELERIFTRVVCHPLNLPEPRSFADLLLYARSLSMRLPYSIAKYGRPEVARALRELLAQQAYDVLVCDFLVPAVVLPWDWKGPKILFTHNVETTIWKRHFQVTNNPLWKLVAWREYRTMKRTERRYLQLADYVLTVSETDRDFFSQWVVRDKITVIPTGVDVEYFQPLPSKETPDSLVFTGSMDWMPNEDAIFYFAEAILPLVRKARPEAVLRVVGRRPSERLRSLAAATPGIEVTGAVDDIRPHVAESQVYVVPLRIGGGTRLKIFEAMAMGKAVVSTTVGMEGLPAAHGKNALLADTPEDFAAAAVRLIEDRPVREQMGRAAREWVEKNYSWAKVVVHLDAVLTKAAGSRAGSSLP